MTRIAITLLLAMCAILGVHAQSLYPGQHTSRVRVHDTAPVRAEAFDLADVRLLPGRVRDNLERDSAWMVSIPPQGCSIVSATTPACLPVSRGLRECAQTRWLGVA